MLVEPTNACEKNIFLE